MKIDYLLKDYSLIKSMELFDIGMPEYQNLYKITKDGKVWSCQSNRFLKTLTNHGNDYQFVNLSRKKNYIHRLVAQTFLDNPNNYTTVDHIDNNRFNNHVHNLRWANRYSQQLNRGCGVPIIWIGKKKDKEYYYWEKTYKKKRYKTHSIHLHKVEEYREEVMKQIYLLEGELTHSPDKEAKFYKKTEEE